MLQLTKQVAELDELAGRLEQEFLEGQGILDRHHLVIGPVIPGDDL